jgi:hypothetical protein
MFWMRGNDPTVDFSSYLLSDGSVWRSPAGLIFNFSHPRQKMAALGLNRRGV